MDSYNVVVPKPVILLIDSAHMVRRNCYQPALRELSNSRGMPTGAIYGYMQSIRSVVSGFSASAAVVCCEGGHSERRKSVYEHYKERDTTKEPEVDNFGYTDFEYYKHQNSWIEAILESLGVPLLRINGKEGDDIIFQATRILEGQKIIISEDSDFFSLVSEDVAVYRPIKKLYVDLNNFEEVTELPSPKHYLYSKVLSGDGSDNIPAVAKGVGWKTIKDVLTSIENPDDLTPKEILKKASSFKGARYAKLVEAGTAPIVRNLDLIDISREEFNIFELEGIKKSLETQRYPDVSKAHKIMSVLEFQDAMINTITNKLSIMSSYSLAPLVNNDYIKRVLMGATSALQG